jgi:hypothetical protein
VFDDVIMGTSEAAETLGVSVSNLGAVVGLPAPVTRLRCGNIYLADEIRTFAEERAAIRAAA